jgi:hypothetical protein
LEGSVAGEIASASDGVHFSAVKRGGKSNNESPHDLSAMPETLFA